jgi:hypothetical protein
MSLSLESWKVLPHGPLTAIDDRLSQSLSLDDLPDLPGTRETLLADEPNLLADQLVILSELSDLRATPLLLDDPIVVELPGEWQQPSEPLF